MDVLGIDSITRIDTERGQSQIIQTIGRVARRAPGKTEGTVVMPVLVRGDESLQSAIARSDHAPIMHLLSALRAADPDLERSLADLRVQIDPKSGEPAAVRRFILDAPTEVSQEFADAVELMLVDQLAPSRRSKPTERGLPDPAPTPLDPYRLARRRRQTGATPAVMQQGMRALDHHRRFGPGTVLVAEIPSLTVEGFKLGRWWRAVCKAWSATFPAPADEQVIADSVTWLSVDAGRYPAVRR